MNKKDIPVLSPGDDFSKWWDAANDVGRGRIASGVYSDDEWVFVHRRKNGTPIRIDAHGAVKSGHGVVLCRYEMNLEGLTVEDAPVGFRSIRGNQTIASCIAKNCGHGFAWEAHDEIKYVRCINSHYDRLVATENDIGFYFNPRPDERPDHNWINASLFNMCSSRGNRIGFMAEHDSWAFNYNTFNTLQIESNTEATIIMPSIARENTFNGCQIVGPQAVVGSLSVISGGRWVTGVNSPGSQIAVSTEKGFFTQSATEKAVAGAN